MVIPMSSKKSIVSLRNVRTDHNGFLVTKSTTDNEEPWNSKEIIWELYRVLMKKWVSADSNVKLSTRRYPEYKTDEIIEHYQGEWIEIEIIESTSTHPFHSIPEAEIIDHTILLPLWYIIYSFLLTYSPKSREKEVYKFQWYNQKQLLEVLWEREKGEEEGRYIQHDIWVVDMSLPGAPVYNIGW